MKFIIGGACQGKREYVSSHYGISHAEMTDGAALSPDLFSHQTCVYHYHLFIKEQLRRGQNLDGILQMTEELLRQNPDIILLMDEVGSGIIPIEKSEREWRETVGRVGCWLAEHAESVERIVCGYGVRIK